MRDLPHEVLLDVPAHACESVVSTLEIIKRDLEILGTLGADIEDIELQTHAHNTVSKVCGNLCASGCIRDEFNRMKAIGLNMPDSDDRELLFGLVDITLTTEMLLPGPVVDVQPNKNQIPVAEVPSVAGADLKEIIMRRIDALDSPEIIQELLRVVNEGNPDISITQEELLEAKKAYITPVKDDETWDEFARFCKGNIRLAQGIMIYFQQVFPIHRSTSPEDVEKANRMATPSMEFYGYNPGFRPSNPYEITIMDFHKLAKMINPRGFINLPTGGFSCRIIHVTDNPEEYSEWILEGDVLEFVAGNNSISPAKAMLAIESKSYEA